MAETRMTTEIGTKAIIKHLKYKHCGGLLIEGKRWLFSKINWVQKYFIISKGGKSDSVWNFFCFTEQFAQKAEWTYSMLEMESVRRYDIEEEDIVGFRILFLAAKMPELILRCDTEENRETWMTKIQEAIEEAHSYSADSGFASGGSIASRRVSRDSKEVSRQSNRYDTIEEADIDDIQDTFSVFKNKRQQRKAINSYEDVEIANNDSRTEERDKGSSKEKNLEDTAVKIPFSVEEINGTGDTVSHSTENLFFDEKLSNPVMESKEPIRPLDRTFSDGIYENAPEDSPVTMRDPVNKISTQETTDKRKAVIVNKDYLKSDFSMQSETPGGFSTDRDLEETFVKESISLPIFDTETAMTLPQTPCLARSESFVSVGTALESSMSSLYVASGTSDVSGDVNNDINMDMNDYQNIDFRCHGDIYNQIERNSSSSSGSDTTTYEKPTRFSQMVKPDEYFCEGGQNPTKIMNGMPEGTFLIIRKKKGLRLHVMTQTGVKCFKIFEQNREVSLYEDFSISPDSVFASLDNFVKHYNVHCIPKEEFNVRLTRGYKHFMKETDEST